MRYMDNDGKTVNNVLSADDNRMHDLIGIVVPVGGMGGSATKLNDDALVVRGGSSTGANSVEGIAKGTGTHPSGVTGFSALRMLMARRSLS
jgi:hypothetical protein